jgi:hypothetical protein
MTPLPHVAAAPASAIIFAGVRPSPAGRSRTSRPSPVCIGAASEGQLPRRIDVPVADLSACGAAQLVIRLR